MKTIFIRDIEIKIYKSKLAKKITISIRPFRGVRITIPYYASYLRAENFAKEKEEWIIINQQKIKSVEEKKSIQNGVLFYGTKYHQLSLSVHSKKLISVRLSDGVINVRYPGDLDENSPQVVDAIKKGNDLALRKEAKTFLPERLDYYAAKFCLGYNEVSIKNMKSRWGSCTAKNKINLTIHLMRLPNHLIDYIILHELAHTIVKNHGKDFWALLDKLTGGAKILDKELRNFRIINY